MKSKARQANDLFIITIFLFLFTMPEKVYDVFWVSHPIHVLLAKTMDTKWFEATCIINLREERKN